MQRQSSYKVHLNTASNGELSDPLCDSANRGLTLVRLTYFGHYQNHWIKTSMSKSIFNPLVLHSELIYILSNEMQIDAGH